MDGLEISILIKSQICDSNLDFRLDSEFFSKQYLQLSLFLEKKLTKPVSCFAKVSDGDHSKFPENQRQEIRYLQAKDIKGHFIESTNPVFVSRKYFEKNKRSHIVEENIILSIMGSVGDIAITPKGFKSCMANRAIAIIRNIKDINPYYLFVYLSTKFAQLQIDRQKNGGVQERINLDALSLIEIPIFNSDFQQQIELIVKCAHQKLDQSKQEYQEAEQLLLNELGLNDFKPSTQNVSIRKLSDSFGDSGRLDSEYYQPKYDDCQNLINQYSDGNDKILNICKIKDENVLPKDDIEYKYIELSNIGNNGDITSCTTNIGKLLPSRARRKINTDDVIISSIQGSMQSCAMVSDKYDNAICSTGFYIINSKEINSETLLIMFKSPLIQSLLTQRCSGTILTAINKDEFLNIRIPIIKEHVQLQVKEHIKSSFNLKWESQNLLELAKHAVEVAIEQDEQTAMGLIKEYLINE